jgi:hypothetical protein
LAAVEPDGALGAVLTTDRAVYSHEDLLRFGERLWRLLEIVSEDPGRSLSGLAKLLPEFPAAPG